MDEAPSVRAGSVLNLPLAPWRPKGGSGAYINLDGSRIRRESGDPRPIRTRVRMPRGVKVTMRPVETD